MSYLPLATPDDRKAHFRRVLDGAGMAEVLGRALPALARSRVRVLRCGAEAVLSRRSLKAGRLRVLYNVDVACGDEGVREFRLLGTTPVDESFLDGDLAEHAEAVRGHPWVGPFDRLATWLPDVEMALQFLPVDPLMPALAEITGAAGRELLGRYLPECRDGGAAIESLSSELLNYRPGNRCVLRVEAGLSWPGGRRGRRTVYVKLFDHDRTDHFGQLERLWTACRGCRHLHVPEPLGWDADRRLSITAEAEGTRELATWIKRLERGEALPEGVGLERLERAVELSAAALAELRGCGLRVERCVSFADHLADQRKDLEVLAASHGGLAATYRGLLDRLEAAAPAAENLVPSHGGFRHKQVMGDDRRQVVLDWDGLTMADPALDGATFVRQLRKAPLADPGGAGAASMEALAAVFRRRFLACPPAVPAGHLGLYEAISIVEMALRSLRRAKTSPDEVERQLGRLAGEAARRLDAAASR